MKREFLQLFSKILKLQLFSVMQYIAEKENFMWNIYKIIDF